MANPIVHFPTSHEPVNPGFAPNLCTQVVIWHFIQKINDPDEPADRSWYVATSSPVLQLWRNNIRSMQLGLHETSMLNMVSWWTCACTVIYHRNFFIQVTNGRHALSSLPLGRRHLIWVLGLVCHSNQWPGLATKVQSLISPSFSTLLNWTWHLSSITNFSKEVNISKSESEVLLLKFVCFLTGAT